MMTRTIARGNSPLTNDQLQRFAPSIFATQPWHAMSERYTFIPTINVIERMRQEGFQPVSAVQSRSRIPGKGDFTKHMIRFRDYRAGDAPAIRTLGTIYPELVLTNSHDGASAYKLDAGLFRLVCTNGMVVSAGNVAQINVRHSGSADGIINATYELVDEFPKVLSSVENMGQLRLSAPQHRAFATAALALRYDDGAAPITPDVIMQARRHEDTAPTLWNAFNIAQERLLNGGDRGVAHTAAYTDEETGRYHRERFRRVRTRAINGISENVRLNKALWTLAEEMKKLAA